MKLSENFVEVVKNFSTINNGMLIKPGKVLRTISSNKAILAEAQVDEEFDSEMGIYDLSKFLGLLSLNKADPEVNFTDEYMVFSGLNGKGKIKQRIADPKVILAPPNKSINVPSYDVTLQLTEEVFNWIFDVASILKCPNITFSSDGGDISVHAVDEKGEIVDSADVEIDGQADKAFKAVMKIENLKLIRGEYTVEISSKGVSRFTNKNKKLVYWVAIESASSSFAKE